MMGLKESEKPGISSMFINAIEMNDVAQVRFMLKYVTSCHINSASKDGLTPLLRACRNGYLHIAKILIENGAVVNKADMNGNTSLHYATMNDDQDMIELLFHCCARTFVRNKNGRLPLDLSSSKSTKKIIAARMVYDGPTEFVAAYQRKSNSCGVLNETHNTKRQLQPLTHRMSLPNVIAKDQCYHKFDVVRECSKRRVVFTDRLI